MAAQHDDSNWTEGDPPDFSKTANNDAANIREQLGKVEHAATEMTTDLLKDYIWQREAFQLTYKQQNGQPFLYGRVNFGDSVEDEWLIVYILRELSSQFPSLWIRVADTDGEFLLVEAANVLPQWLNPDIADNRVWLHEGNLLIIPPSTASDPSSSSTVSESFQPLSLDEALAIISTRQQSLTHSSLIQSEAFHRLRNYPGQILNNLHNAIAIIPRKLACILKLKPHLISPAVESFYLRDPVVLHPLQKKYLEDEGQLAFPPQDLVSVSIKFTRVGYAQLKSQQFEPLGAWKEMLLKVKDTPEFHQMETGMRVTCGFEMFVYDPQKQDNHAVLQVRQLLGSISKGELNLPSDADIAQWEKQQDSENWLDINYEDLDQELSGRRHDDANKGTSFGDRAVQENLRKMVQRFESFLSDETAGIDGAEIFEEGDDMSEDDDDNDVSSDGEDKDVSFDEKEFSRMMREMMGMPLETENELPGPSSDVRGAARVEEVDTDDEQSDDDIDEVMRRVEAELNEEGALSLDPAPRQSKEHQQAIEGRTRDGGSSQAVEDLKEQSEEEDLDIDFSLAKNLLESLKGQSGMPGPGGNLLGLLGINMPRDEGDEEQHGRSQDDRL